ncbi:MAG TPA: hypothetical protein VIG25_09880 [Pyrinomonadaceae bacterium]|jgi:hypothetical protein
MRKTTNTSESGVVRVTLSHQSIRLLDSLAERGLWGRNRAEVAGRFIDEALQKFVDAPRLQLEKTKLPKAR